MSIASRIESINEHLEDAYNSLENIGVDLTNVNKNIENLSMQIESVYDDLPKVTGNGTTINLNSTKKGKIELTLKGNTEQYTTTGKNILAPRNGITTTLNGMTFIYDANTQEVTLNGTCTQDNTVFGFTTGEYNITSDTTLSAHYIGGTITTYGIARLATSTYGKFLTLNLTTLSTSTPVISDTASSSFTTPNSIIRVDNGTVANNFKFKLMLANSTDTSYEPYTGGIASPNPDYPQDIQVVTGENQINIIGKN